MAASGESRLPLIAGSAAAGHMSGLPAPWRNNGADGLPLTVAAVYVTFKPKCS